jgi:hypothetical protein
MITNMPLPTEDQLLEFYSCGLRTGYTSARQAISFKSAKLGLPAHQANVKAQDCAYCPGFHAYNWDENPESVLEAEQAWHDFITRTLN